ncbi:PLP-dependent cysteine synthase family protein [Serpentinicella alkaliphila]|uniref:cysteine synthase n=1 Tax=Serpentinicella alkaliphila TaxID=1734049 RepID=A0A4R2TPP5_9FIRM|nr:PLP-dependent cysteine synthase family protein [Serpentinicella alkaliphila]TCQ03275.1 cysteine synthase A [Serpentinicella alkaliphila]
MYINNLQMRFNNLTNIIGSTPLLEIVFKYLGEERTIYVKAEHYNMTGSIKDRMALHILKKAYEENMIKPGDRIVEATSGNTGIAFSAIGRSLGHRVTIFMPDWMSQERKNLIRSFGADIKLLSQEEGGFLGSISSAEELARNNENIFLPYQFSNEFNSEAHFLTTGEEIWNQLINLNIVPDAVVAGVGTGGTIMGIGKSLRSKNPNIKVFPLEPSNSPTMSTGYKVGKHRIQGISDEFIPPIVKLDELDEIIDVDDGDAIVMAQKLAANLGLGVGISSGANFLGAIKAQQLLGSQSVVVTVFPDDNKKYLSTDLMNRETIKPDFISTNVELLSFKAHRYKCSSCTL